MTRLSRPIVALAVLSVLVCGAHAADPPKSQSVATKDVDRGKYLVQIGGCNDCHTPGYAATGGKVPEKDWLVGDQLVARCLGHDLPGQSAPVHAEGERTGVVVRREIRGNASADALVQSSRDDRCGSACRVSLHSFSWPSGHRSAGVSAAGPGAEAAVRAIPRAAAEIRPVSRPRSFRLGPAAPPRAACSPAASRSSSAPRRPAPA